MEVKAKPENGKISSMPTEIFGINATESVALPNADTNSIKSVVTDVLMGILSKAFGPNGNNPAGLSALAESHGIQSSRFL